MCFVSLFKYILRGWKGLSTFFERSLFVVAWFVKNASKIRVIRDFTNFHKWKEKTLRRDMRFNKFMCVIMWKGDLFQTLYTVENSNTNYSYSFSNITLIVLKFNIHIPLDIDSLVLLKKKRTACEFLDKWIKIVMTSWVAMVATVVVVILNINLKS